MTIADNKEILPFYQEYEENLEVKRMFLTDRFNSRIFHKHFELLQIKPNMQIIDFGCGPGITTRDLAKRTTKGSVFGIDINNSAIESAIRISKHEKVNNVKFAIMSADNVFCPNNSYDMSFARNLLMHVSRPKKVIKEMIRVTKPGGTIAVVSSDGFMSKIFPLKKDLREYIETLKSAGVADTKIGRELYTYFKKYKLNDIQINIDNWMSIGIASELEKEYWSLMFQQRRTVLDKILGGRDKLLQFKKLWFEFLNREDRFDFFQIFLVKGIKPR
ncbi:MAG: class I SAM-dependent methyltransferase [Candidatus Helarchaeota archaeon]